MNYTENSSENRKKFNAGLYIIIAVCLLALGGAAWFALSRYEDNNMTPRTLDNSSEYSGDNSSYNESVIEPPSLPIESTAESVSEVPYSSEQPTQENKNYFTMPVEGEIIKDFSSDVLQYSKTYGDMRLHTGIDIACKEGTSVGACADGTVVSIDQNATLGCGVVIEHSGGITVKYYSLAELKVKEGDKVKMGDTIGTVSTVPAECADTAHIHLVVLKNNTPVNPLEALGLNEAQ